MQFIVGIAALILLHEFGHFIVARLLNVEVEEFGLGFPPRIVKLFEAGGTEYTLNWIPLGGFVRPKGENDPTVPGGLAAASPWVRLAVLFAGPGMNILVGVILGVMFFYSLGDPVLNQVRVDQVMPDSPAALAGLQKGDLFVSINGQPVDATEKMQSLVGANNGQPITMVVVRNGQQQTITVTPKATTPDGRATIGVYLGHPRLPINFVTAVQRGAYAAYENMRGILVLPFRILQGQANSDETRLVGYKGMFEIYQQIQNPLWFFMAISISLGIINLFPIPALDGGRILLTLPEIFLRRRIPPRYENVIHIVGFTLLLILIIYINVQDFINPLNLNR